jgi:hypothetical protein
MPLELPTLDDRRYADLVEEARRLIPVYDPEWTNHNPSDPGITLLELFAYLTEMLLYRLDRVTTDNQGQFLKLLNGPDWNWQPGQPVTGDDVRTAVLAVRARGRAVTTADYERLATDDFNQWLAAMQRAEQGGASLDEWWLVTRLARTDPANGPSAVARVARAACVAARNLDRGTEALRTEYAPAHVSLVVLPQDPGAPQPSDQQKAALWGYLDERRTLTTRHHVVGPHYAPVSAEIVIAATSGALPAAVRDRVLDGIANLLAPLPLTSGSASDATAPAGWPFGRDIFASEVYERIEAVVGVDYITDLMLFSDCPATDEQCVAAQPIWHAEGDLVGLALAPHHLPLAGFDAAAIVVAPGASFVPVQVKVTLTPGTVDPATLKRRAKAAVRAFFHPLHQGPGPDTPTDSDLLLADLNTALAVADLKVAALDLRADAARLLPSAAGATTGLRIRAGEVVNWRTEIVLEGA